MQSAERRWMMLNATCISDSVALCLDAAKIDKREHLPQTQMDFGFEERALDFNVFTFDWRRSMRLFAHHLD